MKILKPGQTVIVHQPIGEAAVEGRITCASLYDDGSVQYTVRFWVDGEPTCYDFSEGELQESMDAQYLEVSPNA